MSAEIHYLFKQPETQAILPEDEAANFACQLYNAMHSIHMDNVHYFAKSQLVINGEIVNGREVLHKVAQRICKIIHHIDTGANNNG